MKSKAVDETSKEAAKVMSALASMLERILKLCDSQDVSLEQILTTSWKKQFMSLYSHLYLVEERMVVAD